MSPTTPNLAPSPAPIPPVDQADRNSVAGIAVTVSGVTAIYEEAGQWLEALSHVSLEIPAGSFVSIIGPSGCGKTTLLDIIAGLQEPISGSIAFDGRPTSAEARLGRSAYMHQRDLLMPWRTAIRNAALPLELRGVGRAAARAAAAAAFARFGLTGFEDRYPAQLSGGMRQRVAFVRTMLGGQPLLLLDEPFGSLDAMTRSDAQFWLAEAIASEPRTALLVTHDVDEAILLADRVLVLSSRPGRVVHVETIAPARPRPRSFLLSETFAASRARVLGALGFADGVGP